jgi:hypothetical protein
MDNDRIVIFMSMVRLVYHCRKPVDLNIFFSESRAI